MSDDFLHQLRREPRPGFSRALRERLREQDEARAARGGAWRPWLATAASVAAIALAFTFPAVRVSAQAVLDLFRVRTFAAVRFDPARFERIESMRGAEHVNLFERRNVGQEPGEPRLVASLEEAGRAAGMRPMAPATLPPGLEPDSVFVTGAGEADFVVNGERLRTMLDALELRDVAVPAGLDGRAVHVRLQPGIAARYRGRSGRVTLMQAQSPEVRVPPGVDLAQVGEVGLRVLGLSPPEARRMARRIDWTNTLVVPVPTSASEFREVTVNGQRGLMIGTRERRQDGRTRRGGTVILWSEGDRVLALQGNLESVAMMHLAESVR